MLLRRFRYWLNREKRRHALQEELQLHISERAAELRESGLNDSEARTEAQRRFGNVGRTVEDVRAVWTLAWLEVFLRDVRYALRSFRKYPKFALIVILTIALGVGATTAIFSIVNGVLIKPLPYPESDRLVAVWESAPERGFEIGSFAYLNYQDLAAQNRSFIETAAWRFDAGVILYRGESDYAVARQISSNLLSVLGTAPLSGRTFASEEDVPGAPPVALISQGFATRYFSDGGGPLGSVFTFKGKLYTVVGVLPSVGGILRGVDLVTPLGQNDTFVMQNRLFHPGIRVVARLRPGVEVADARTEAREIARRLKEAYADVFISSTFVVNPLDEDILGSQIPRTLVLLLSVVGLLLLIACANVASLLVARAISRNREFGIRAALGAGRGRIVRLCLTESLVLALCGGALGVLMARGILDALLSGWPGTLPRGDEVNVDGTVLLFALATSILTGLAFGLAPAWERTDRLLSRVFRTAGRGTVCGGRGTQTVLVVSEIALALVLLTGSGATIRTMLALWSTDPGFDVSNSLMARLLISTEGSGTPEATRQAWERLLDDVQAMPDVESAALTTLVPLTNDDGTLPYWPSPEPPPLDERPLALLAMTTPEYAEAVGVPLRDGRYFSDFDRNDTEPVAVIDEVLAASAFPGDSPVGRRLWLEGTEPARIVGVVGHVRHWGLQADERAPVRAQIFLPWSQMPDDFLDSLTSMSVVARTRTAPETVVPQLGRIVEDGGVRAVRDARTMEQVVNDSMISERFLLFLFNAFGILALFLAAVGLYGVLSYLSQQRTAEFGVRTALGARRSQITRLVLSQGLWMCLTGSMIGVVLTAVSIRFFGSAIGGALMVGTYRPFENRSEGVPPISLAVVAVAFLVLVAVALVASFLPARRASRVDPMVALRLE